MVINLSSLIRHGYLFKQATLVIFSVYCPLLSSQTGQTALMAASSGGHLPIVERLLAAGAQPDLQKKVPLVQWGWKVIDAINENI